MGAMEDLSDFVYELGMLRRIRREEYRRVIEHARELGLRLVE